MRPTAIEELIDAIPVEYNSRKYSLLRHKFSLFLFAIQFVEFKKITTCDNWLSKEQNWLHQSCIQVSCHIKKILSITGTKFDVSVRCFPHYDFGVQLLEQSWRKGIIIFCAIEPKYSVKWAREELKIYQSIIFYFIDSISPISFFSQI